MRNYFKAILSTALLAIFMASGIIASAQDSEWKALRDGVVTNRPQTPAKPSPMQMMRQKYGKALPASRIAPSQDGMYPTPKITQKPANILKSPQNPRGSLYGVINRFSDMEYTHQAYVASFEMATGKMTKLFTGSQFCPYSGYDYMNQTNTYANGSIYCPTYTSDVGGEYSISMVVCDFATGKITGRYILNTDLNPYSITYDSKEGVFYALTLNLTTYKDSILVKIVPDEANGEYKVFPLAELTDQGSSYLSAICYNPSTDKLYVFNNLNNVYSIAQKAEGYVIVEEGYLDCNDLPFDEGVTGQVAYSPADEMFLVILRDDFIQANRLLYVHPETFEVFYGPYLAMAEKPYIAAIFITDDYAEPDATEIVAEPTISFPDAALTGTIEIVAPSYSYVGVELGNTPFKLIAEIDGKEIYNADVTPGQKITLNPTLDEAEHTLTIVTYVGELPSPVRTVVFYTGYDAPRSPQNIAINGNSLSWDKPGSVGMHNGLVDTDNITYNVYLNDEKQNAEPITSESFILTPPALQAQYKIEVEAISHDHASERGVINEVYGAALQLPFFQKPTADEKGMYRTVNYNEDDRIWFWTDDTENSGADMYGWAMVVGYINAADDWLIFPLINFPSSESLYTLAFDVAGVMQNLTTTESYELYLGKEPNVKSMLEGICIYKDNYYSATNAFEHKIYNFAVPEAGEYYFAIRVNSTKETHPAGQGLLFNDFDIRIADGRSSAIPADPTDIVITPDPEGFNDFFVEALLPTKDISGRDLDPDMDVTLTVAVDNNQKTATGKPGAKVHVDHAVINAGFTNVAITPSNDNGSGYTRYHRRYIGVDTPLCPTNIKATLSADNLTMHYTWDAPGVIGQNNGVVRPDELYYKFYTRAAQTLAYVGQTTKCEFDYSPYGEESRPQSAVLAGSSACNEVGESLYSIFYQDEVGTPYELPMKEEFGTSKFDFSPYRYVTTGDCAASTFENVGDMSSYNIGNPQFVQGGLLGYSTSFGDSRFVMPKVTTQGIRKTMFGVRYWDYAGAPEGIQIYLRRYGKEDEFFAGEFKFNHPALGEWVDAQLSLPEEYNNCPWIQVRIGCIFKDPTQYLVLDNYEVFADINYDLKISSFEGLNVATIGEAPTYKVTVANAGRERMNGTLTVEIGDKYGKVLASSETAIPMLNASQYSEHEVTFDLTGEFSDLKDIVVTARIESDLDDYTANNTKTINLEIKDSPLAAVSDLVAEPKDTSVNLSWSTPGGTYGDFENFDYLQPFQITDQIGSFKNVDLDGQIPLEIGNGSIALEWPGSKLPQAWTVVNMEDLKLMNDSRIYPHSGKQVLMVRSNSYADGEVPVQSSKWLISPEVVPGSKISFWFSTIESSYTEYLEIWTSETGTELNPDRATSTRNGDFRKQEPKSKVGSETWELVTYRLPAKAKYFALRYSSYDGLALVLDDLSFTPANKLDKTVDHYSVYRVDDNEEPQLLAADVKDNTFVDNTWDDTKHAAYYVTAISNYDGRFVEGPKSNIVRLAATGVGNISADRAIYGAKGEIRINGFEGEDLVIASPDGKVVLKTTVRSPQAHYGLTPGIYIATCGKKTVKVVVK